MKERGIKLKDGRSFHYKIILKKICSHVAKTLFFFTLFVFVLFSLFYTSFTCRVGIEREEHFELVNVIICLEDNMFYTVFLTFPMSTCFVLLVGYSVDQVPLAFTLLVL
jgi:hypothetical protein